MGSKLHKGGYIGDEGLGSELLKGRYIGDDGLGFRLSSIKRVIWGIIGDHCGGYEGV